MQEEINISGKLLPVHPKPNEDELLTSWLIRLSRAHGMTLSSFCSLVLHRGGDPWSALLTVDLDKCVKSDLLTILSEKTGTTLERVMATTLLPYEEALYEKSRSARRRPWIMPFALTSGKRKNVRLQFCLQCLSEDREPYIRRRWRLAFNCLCEKHQIQLYDYCPVCKAGFAFRRKRAITSIDFQLNPITHCHICGSDFRSSGTHRVATTVTKEEVEFQQLLIKSVEQGWIEIAGSGPVYSHLFFPVLHRLARLLSDNKRGVSLQEKLSNKVGIQMSEPLLRVRAKELEYLSVGERRSLIYMTGWILTDWPNRFIVFCKENKVWSLDLLYTLAPVPFWYWSVVHDHLTRIRYKPADQEIQSATAWIRKTYSNNQSHKNIKDANAVLDYFGRLTHYRKKALLGSYKIADRRYKTDKLISSGVIAQRSNGISNFIPPPQYISDTLWAEVEPHIPFVLRRNQHPDDRTALNGMLYVLSTRCTWEQLPIEFGRWKRVYTRYHRWRELGAFNLIWSLCNQLYH